MASERDAIGVGLGVTEFNPKGQTDGEIRRLWSWSERRMQVGRLSRQVSKQAKAA